MKCYNCKKYIKPPAEYCPACGVFLGYSDELIQRAINGDELAQQELYERTYNDVYCTIMAITKDEDLIMDMVQDTYLVGFQKLDQLKDSNRFCAWLRQIAHNRTLNALRDRRVLRTAAVISTETEVVLDVEDDHIDRQPEASMDQKETSRLVKEILDDLPDDQRVVVGMYYYEQLSVSEIADELKCSENTVKSRLNYGRKKIQVKVLDLEKKGTKLYSLAPLPFFVWLLRNLYREPDKDIFKSIREKLVQGSSAGLGKNGKSEKADEDSSDNSDSSNDDGTNDENTSGSEGNSTEKESDLSSNSQNSTTKSSTKNLKNAATVAKTGIYGGIKAKLIAGVVAVAVIGGGVYFTKQNNKTPEDTESSTEDTETPTDTPAPEPVETSTPTPSITQEPAKTIKDIIENSTEYSYIGGTTYDVTYSTSVLGGENGSDAGINLSEAPTGVVGAMKKDMDGDNNEELLLAILKPVDQTYIDNGKKDAALYFEVYKQQGDDWTSQGGTTDEDAFKVNITDCFPNTKAVWSGNSIVVFEDMAATFPADPGVSGAIYTYDGSKFTCMTNEDAGEIDYPGEEFTSPVANASSEDLLCQITIPEIYDNNDYSIVNSVNQGSTVSVTLAYRDNGSVDAEQEEISNDTEQVSEDNTDGVEQFDLKQNVDYIEEMNESFGYVKPQLSNYDDVIKLYCDAIKNPEELSTSITNTGIAELASKDSNDALTRLGYAYIDLDGNGKDELIIGKEDMVYEIYSQDNGIEKIFECSNYRESGWFVDDNVLVWTGTGGAGYHSFYAFKLTDGEWKTLENLTVDTSVNPEDVDRLNQLDDEYTEKKISISFTSFSEVQ